MNRTVRTHTAALALSVMLGALPASAVAGERAAAATTATSAALANVRIDNFGQVNPNYYRGAQPKGQDFANLSAVGVKLVIDLAEEGDPAEEANATSAGMHFVRIPMNTHQGPSAETIGRFLALVNDPANQPVYVHCIGGRHRTGVMTAIYRMTDDNWTAARAFQEMKQYKFGADFLHQEFKDFVYSFVPAAAAVADVKGVK